MNVAPFMDIKSRRFSYKGLDVVLSQNQLKTVPFSDSIRRKLLSLVLILLFIVICDLFTHGALRSY